MTAGLERDNVERRQPSAAQPLHLMKLGSLDFS